MRAFKKETEVLAHQIGDLEGEIQQKAIDNDRRLNESNSRVTDLNHQVTEPAATFAISTRWFLIQTA